MKYRVYFREETNELLVMKSKHALSFLETVGWKMYHYIGDL